MASQQIGNEHSCGASILNSRWLLTAAHCLGGSISQYSVVVGMHDRAQRQGNPVRHSIRRTILHPKWENNGAKGWPNDIALIEVNSPMDLNDRYAGAITMASPGQSFVGSTCYVIGWGLTSQNGQRAPVLKETQVDVYTNEECSRQNGSNMVHDFHICVGDYGRSTICSSDSGGPLACQVGSSWVLAGATSWGACSVDSPAAYTRVSYYRDWVRQNAGIWIKVRCVELEFRKWFSLHYMQILHT